MCPNFQVGIVTRTSRPLPCGCVPVACCLALACDTRVSAWHVHTLLACYCSRWDTTPALLSVCAWCLMHLPVLTSKHGVWASCLRLSALRTCPCELVARDVGHLRASCPGLWCVSPHVHHPWASALANLPSVLGMRLACWTWPSCRVTCFELWGSDRKTLVGVSHSRFKGRFNLWLSEKSLLEKILKKSLQRQAFCFLYISSIKYKKHM